MSVSFQRLLLILFSLIFLTSSILLILFNYKKNLIFFYTPSELINSDSAINDVVRIGGFVEKYSIPFDCIDDNNGEMVSLLGASVYSEVFIKFDGVLIYKGMIDDSYSDLGQWSPAENNYLYDVLEQLLQGKNVEYFETEAIGCLI